MLGAIDEIERARRQNAADQNHRGQQPRINLKVIFRFFLGQGSHQAVASLMPGAFTDFSVGMIEFIFLPLGTYTGTRLIAKRAIRVFLRALGGLISVPSV
jgi:hypothetical protein